MYYTSLDKSIRQSVRSTKYHIRRQTVRSAKCLSANCQKNVLGKKMTFGNLPLVNAL